MDLNLSSFGTLAPAAPCYAFYAIRHHIYCRFDTDDMVFAITLICYHAHKHTQDTQEPIGKHTYEYILTPSVMYNNLLIQKFTLQRFKMSAFRKFLICRSRTCWLDLKKLSPSCEIHRILMEMVGLVLKLLDSQSSAPKFKTTGWFQGRLSLSSFQGQSNEYQEFLGTYW